MRLLVHAAGEADLLLDTQGPWTSTDHHERARERAARIERRHEILISALASNDPATAVSRLLRDGRWPDPQHSRPGQSPLVGALGTGRFGADLHVVILGTEQEPSGHQAPTVRLDTLPTARLLRQALATRPDAPQEITVLTVPGLTERPVATALAAHLAGRHYDEAFVTWGTGATALALGALTALSGAGIRWQLLRTDHSEYQTIDPLASLDTDPVVNVLVRWRLFGALDELASKAVLQLSPAQYALVHSAADRYRQGLEAQDTTALRAVLADAVVRQDGTASMTARRYITARYEELLAAERLTRPKATDLLRHFNRGGHGRTPLGGVIAKIRKARDEPVVQQAAGNPSLEWLSSPECSALQEIGRGSHTLSPPPADSITVVSGYLASYQVDGTGWPEAGLPQPPIAPAGTVLVVWMAGTGHHPTSIGRQLIDGGLPTPIRDHLTVRSPQVRAAILGTAGPGGSIANARAEADMLTAAQRLARPYLVDGPDGLDPEAVHDLIVGDVTPETAALLLVPVGPKPAVLTLLHAMRRIGAERGVPLFVRQTATPPAGGTALGEVHLWPALTGGDLALLVAAREALGKLELDVTWRLLAASAIDAGAVDQARRLAAAFASRDPDNDHQWPDPDPAPRHDRIGRTAGLIAQRLELVRTVLDQHQATGTDDHQAADRLRLLVLAADAVEASIAATAPQPPNKRPGHNFGKFKEKLTLVASGRSLEARHACAFLVLDEARNKAPITHGTAENIDPDAIVAKAANWLAGKIPLSTVVRDALPGDLRSLMDAVITAASARCLGKPDQAASLLSLYRHLDREIATALAQRTSRSP